MVQTSLFGKIRPSIISVIYFLRVSIKNSKENILANINKCDIEEVLFF